MERGGVLSHRAAAETRQVRAMLDKPRPILKPWARMNRTMLPLASYPNVTIEGPGLRAIVYLPDANKGYYRSSRYDWGSMVGHVQLQVPNLGGNVTLFTDVRPRPHRPLLSDHVLGLAAEFGCGVRGTLCSPGHGHDLLATNGVLGYGDAGRGGTFMKIGVGKLLRPYAAR